MTIIENARVIRNGEILTGERIAFDRGIIVPTPQKSDPADRYLDAQGNYVSAGFVDIHVHGGGGADFLDATEDAFLTVANLHAQYGTTTLLPTATSSSQKETLVMMRAYERAQATNLTGADMPGLHFEGPYFSPEQCGAQDPSQLRTPDPKEYLAVLDAGSRILRWSAAPELPGSADFAKALIARGVLPAIGHSNAEFDETAEAFQNGFTHVTHLYSCTSTVHRKNAIRHAGVVESAYLTDGMTVEIIADGIHLPPALLQMVYRFIGPDRTALVTDAIRGAGMPDGPSILGSLKNGLPILIEDGVGKLPDRTALAGSVATMNRLVWNMVHLAQVPLPDAVKMASQTPATIVGLTDRGTLDPGKRADIVIFDDELQIHQTIVGGRTVYARNDQALQQV